MSASRPAAAPVGHGRPVEEVAVLGCVGEGVITKMAGVYMERGEPASWELISALDMCVWEGWLRVEEGDPLWDVRAVRLSDAGAARYAVLRDQERAGQHFLQDPQYGPQAPAGRRLSAPAVMAPGGRSGSS
ncbi:MAG: hypothetical protein ACRDTG_29085 [Pseudonocardiaceae bacterium]